MQVEKAWKQLTFASLVLIGILWYSYGIVSVNVKEWHVAAASSELGRSVGLLVSNDQTNKTNAQNDECGDVLRDMVRGRWVQGHMTPQDVIKMRDFYREAREVQQNVPRGSQRPDLKCGNIIIRPWFRALCDPDGATPCCYNNVCVNKTVQQCTCKNCFDMRSRLQAEYSTWKPENKTCQPRAMPVNEICALLKNSTLQFIGDSLVRHVYTALMLAITGNDETGAYAPNMPKELVTKCRGLYMFTEKVCRMWLYRKASLCNGTVELKMDELYNLGYTEKIKKVVLDLVRSRKKVMVFIGIGFHNQLKFDPVKNTLVQPLLQAIKAERASPEFKLIWACMHKFGLMRQTDQFGNERVHSFNERIKRFLQDWRVPVFETEYLTDQVMSFDGQHYGFGVNRMKAQILLHYIRQLRLRGEW